MPTISTAEGEKKWFALQHVTCSVWDEPDRQSCSAAYQMRSEFEITWTGGGT